MKKAAIFLLLICSLYACKKEELVKTTSYADLVYEIDNSEDSLYVIFRRAVSNDTANWNKDFDTVLTQHAIHYIEGRVLLGLPVMLYGYSEQGGDFHLRIKDEDGTTLVETDTVAHYSANQLHPEYWVSKLEFTP